MDHIQFKNFKGMDARLDTPDHGLGRDKGKGVAIRPRLIMNADVIEGRIVRAPQLAKIIDLPNMHSLVAAGGYLFCAADGKFFELVPGAALANEICEFQSQDNQPLSYAEIENVLYVSASHWTAKIPLTRPFVAKPLGPEVPPTPAAAPQTHGNLSPGAYTLIFAPVEEGKLFGNGPTITVDVSGENAGIQIFNRPADCEVFCTDANGTVMYRLGKMDTITHIVSAEPFPHLWCRTPYRWSFLAGRMGRLWGARGNTLFWSQPFRPELCRDAYDKLVLPHDITGIAFTNNGSGAYIGTTRKTYFWSGNIPLVEQSQLREIGPGMLPGSIVYVSGEDLAIPEMGDNVPLWLGGEGVVAGGNTGQTVMLSRKTVAINANFAFQAPMVAFHQSGYFRLLASYAQSKDGMALGENITCTVARNGTVIQG